MPPKKEKIEALTLREQVLLRPDTYLGSTNIEKITKDLFRDEQIQAAEFDYNHGLFQIFVEIISNAVDNVARSRKFSIDPGEIHVEVSDTEVVVTNWGYSIPIEKHHTLTDQYIPHVAFFNLLTSSNYDDSVRRKSSGRNGLGGSLTNIFSQKFCIQVYDNSSNKYFEQTSFANLSKVEPAIVKTVTDFPYSICVRYTADFERFKMSKYTPEFKQLMEKYVIDAAAITGIRTTFNGRAYKTSFKDYAVDYYYPDDEPMMIHLPSVVPDDDSADTGFKLEVIVVEGEGPEVSFVNGVVTDAGGTHVKSVWDALLPELAKRVKTKLKFEPSQTQIKKYFRLFLNTQLYNPAFGSQSKAKLVSKVPKISLPAASVNQMMEWEWVELYHDFHRAQNQKSRAKTDGKKVAHVNVEKAVDANMAGRKESHKCTLIITEGDSAKGFAVNGRAAIENGTDYYGVYPIRGKGLNTMNAKEEKINKNKEIQDIKALLGLKTGVDYSQPENRRKLRYGGVMVLSDADDDGLHIRGLTLLIFTELFEPLLACGFVRFMETPVVRVYKTKKLLEEFYTYNQFNKWMEGKSKTGYEIRHIKGLGTSRQDEQKNAFRRPFFVDLEYTEECKASMQLAFNNKRADDRKIWLASITPRPDPARKMSVKTFIDDHFKHFSWADTARNIPAIDGLKQSQRKCLWVGFFMGLHKNTASAVRLSDFKGQVSSKSHYDHNADSLSKAVILMAQSYTGSNNLPYFTDDGQFGTRYENGNDAAADRYNNTNLRDYTSVIFNPLDEPLLKQKNQGGHIVEPYVYYPVICMALVNGERGIGTGYSCFIHSYNPRDIIKLHREWLSFVEKHRAAATAPVVKTPSTLKPTLATNTTTTAMPPQTLAPQKAAPFIVKKKAPPQPVAFYPSKILPYFHGYKGTIKQEGNTIYMYGVFTVNGDTITVTEIPTRYSFEKYLDQCKSWREEGYIKDYKDYGDTTDHKYVLIGYDEEKFGGPPSYERLLLRDTLQKETINLLDETNTRVLHFDNIYELLSHYSKIRLRKYEERRQLRIKHLKDEYPQQQLRYKFILQVMEGSLVINNRDEKDVFRDMDAEGYPHDFLGMAVRSFTKQKLEDLQRLLQGIKDEIDYLAKITDVELWRKELAELETCVDNI